MEFNESAGQRRVRDFQGGAPAKISPLPHDPAAEPFEEAYSSDLNVGPLHELQPVVVSIKDGTPLLPFGGESSHAAEQYRIIRTKLLQHAARPRSLVMTSAESGDGKSVTSVNLAGVLALNPDYNVILVDGDLHRSSLARYFGVDASPGLADVITGKATLYDAIRRVEPFPNLFFLPGGKSQTGPADLFNTSRWQEVAAALKDQFTFAVIDAPPAGVFADFELIQAQVDGVVLVVREDHTNRLLWMRAMQTIPSEKLMGVIMNCVQPWFLGKSFGYYQYYYYSKYYTGQA
jgi:capsular exopolysaccharide synthesis family protein